MAKKIAVVAPVAEKKEDETNNNGKDKKKAVVLSSAPPPWHSVAFIGILTGVCIYNLPSFESIDGVATMETFVNCKLVASPFVLGMVRLLFAFLVWFQVFHTVFLCEGWTQVTNFLPSSKLKSGVEHRFRGWKTQTYFTSLCWIVMGIYTTTSALLPLLYYYNNEQQQQQQQQQQTTTTAVQKWMLRIAYISWEIAAPTAPLVSFVVKYAIWPRALPKNGGKGSAVLRHWRNMLAHNANSVMVLCEMAFLGGLPIQFSHFALAPLFGALYVLFTWSMIHRWTAPEHGPQFIYFFFDTTLPGYQPTIALLVLITVLSVFFVLFATISHALDPFIGGLLGGNNNAATTAIANSLYVILVSKILVRVRD